MDFTSKARARADDGDGGYTEPPDQFAPEAGMPGFTLPMSDELTAHAERMRRQDGP